MTLSSDLFSLHYFINKKIFQRTPVKDSPCSKQSIGRPKAPSPYVIESLGRKVNVKPQAFASCCLTPRPLSADLILCINSYLFPTLLDLPCRLTTRHTREKRENKSTCAWSWIGLLFYFPLRSLKCFYSFHWDFHIFTHQTVKLRNTRGGYLLLVWF